MRGATKIGDSMAAVIMHANVSALTNVESIRGDLGTTLHLAKRKKRSDRNARPERNDSQRERTNRGTERNERG